jgi:uncharacterized membrane protein YfcA
LRLNLLHQPFQRRQETPKKGLLGAFGLMSFFVGVAGGLFGLGGGFAILV